MTDNNNQQVRQAEHSQPLTPQGSVGMWPFHPRLFLNIADYVHNSIPVSISIDYHMQGAIAAEGWNLRAGKTVIGKLFAQLDFLNLAGGRVRDFVDERHRIWHPPFNDFVSHEVQNIPFLWIPPLLPDAN